MSQTISSAEPLQLLRYSDVMVLVDDALVTESNRLRAALEHFEATCREGAFRLQVSHVADYLVQYAQQARGVDLWVRDVGVGFQLADGGGMYMCVSGPAGSLITTSVPGNAVDEDTLNEIDGLIQQWLKDHAQEYDNVEDLKKALAAFLITLLHSKGLQKVAAYSTLIVENIIDGGKLGPIIGQIYHGLRVSPHGLSTIQFDIAGAQIKDMVGWSKQLGPLKFPPGTVTKYGLTWRTFTSLGVRPMKPAMVGAFKDSFWPKSNMGKGFAAINFLLTGWENYQDYGDEGVQKVACGIVVDSAIDVACTTVFTGAGVAAGVAVGTMIGGPLGAAIGAQVGRFAGGVAGAWIANGIKETDFDEWATDQLDTGVDNATDKIGNALSGASESTGETLSNASAATGAALSDAASALEHALTPAVQNVAGWF